MITELQQEQEQLFQSQLQTLFDTLPAGPLHKYRTKGWERFLELGLPTRKNDVYKYVPLRKLYNLTLQPTQSSEVTKKDIEPHILPECRNSHIVFLNGLFLPHHSTFDPKIIATSIDEATRTYSTFISNLWTKGTKEELDPFAALNLALHQQGLFLYIPPKTVIETPLQLIFLSDSKEQTTITSPKVLAFLGRHAQLSLITTQGCLSGDKGIQNLSVEIAIEEDAHLNYTQDASALPTGRWYFDALRCTMKRDSTLKTVMTTEGCVTARHDYKLILQGENIEAHLNGVSMLSKHNESHVHVLIDHQAPNCRSLQLFKNALADYSHSAFEGKILVKREAQKTDAFQLNNNLLLSDHAQADSKPNLEIFADDVKASHGSTVGQLDNEQIFYMKTRGFTEAQAKNLLVKGYCAEVIEQITTDSLRNKMRAKAASFLI